MTAMKISLAMSGGGVRAAVYHLGVLDRLARGNLLENVILLSTVSGGSMGTGLVYALNDFKWPSSEQYLEKISPQARKLMTTRSLQRSLIVRSLLRFWTLAEARADDLSVLMQKHWNMTARLSDLPAYPRWMINTTCYETGKNWRFERFRMGDYKFGYSSNTDIPLADAVAASAGFPGLIGALTFETGGREWFRYQKRADPDQLLADPDEESRWEKVPVKPHLEKVHLWDGGVYDNHGLEGIHNFSDGWSKRFDFLIVSDAAGRSGEAKYAVGVNALMRLSSGIMMDQVRSLRTRAILERLTNHKDEDRGVFLQMGSTIDEILKNAKHEDWLPRFKQGSMDPQDVAAAARTPTVIRQLSDQEFENLYHHGYEVADGVLCAYYPDDFQHIAY